MKLVPSADKRTCDQLSEHLDGTTACNIYEQRPVQCRIDVQKPADMSLRQYHEITAAACNKLQEAEGTSPAFKVHLLPKEMYL